MIDSYFKVIEPFLIIYSMSVVFLLGIFEEIAFFIPMSLLFVAAGFFIIGPNLKFLPALLTAIFQVSFPGTLGVIVGGLIIYKVIYWGGKPLIKKFGSYVNLDWSDVEQLNKKFKAGHIDEIILIFLRVIPIFPIGIVSIFCGLVRLTVGEFVWTTFVGTFIRLAGLSLLGWYLGKEYVKYALQIAAIEKYLGLVFLAAVFIALIYSYAKQRKYSEKR